MGLPEAVRVKISSEAAGAISLTAVVARDMPLRELVELMLAVTGKDEPRLRELLARGAFVSGASRFRWQGFDPGCECIRNILDTFPDSEPQRPFDASRCRRVVLRTSVREITIPRDAGSARKLFRRSSFWQGFMQIAAQLETDYRGYSYGEKADVYRIRIGGAELARLRELAGLLKYSTLRDQVRMLAIEAADLYVARGRGWGFA